MQRHRNRVKIIGVSRARRKMISEKVTRKELLQYQSPAKTLTYSRKGVLPQTALFLSIMQQKVSNLVVQGLVVANVLTGRLQSVKPHPAVCKRNIVIVLINYLR